jgi:hypothetical protein
MDSSSRSGRTAEEEEDTGYDATTHGRWSPRDAHTSSSWQQQQQQQYPQQEVHRDAAAWEAGERRTPGGGLQRDAARRVAYPTSFPQASVAGSLVQQALKVEAAFFTLLAKLREYVLEDLAVMLTDEWDALAKPGCRAEAGSSGRSTSSETRSFTASVASSAPQVMARVEVARREKELEWKLCWHRATDDDTAAYDACERGFATAWSRLTSSYGKVLRASHARLAGTGPAGSLPKQVLLFLKLRELAPPHLVNDPQCALSPDLLQLAMSPTSPFRCGTSRRSGSSSGLGSPAPAAASSAEVAFAVHRRLLLRRARDGYFPPAAVSKLLGGSTDALSGNASSSLPLGGGRFRLVDGAPQRVAPNLHSPYASAAPTSAAAPALQMGSPSTIRVATASSRSPERARLFPHQQQQQRYSPGFAISSGGGYSLGPQPTYTEQFWRQRQGGAEGTGSPRERGAKWV